VTLVIDAAPLVALADEREPRREEILSILRSERGSLFVPAPVTAEIDYLLGQRFGPAARRAFLDDLAARR
jgi:predicted nucleic acid-binding protein